MWLYLKERMGLLVPQARIRLLEIAPSECISSRLSALKHVEYITGDLKPNRRLRILMDITRIPFPDESFDAVYCSHVLEHVLDDRAAMHELFRVLTRTGWAILQVPTRGTNTLEDPSITTPEAREKAFGQGDHVRIYGLDDYVGRLEQAGFSVTVDRFAREMPENRRLRFGISAHEPVFLCVK